MAEAEAGCFGRRRGRDGTVGTPGRKTMDSGATTGWRAIPAATNLGVKAALDTLHV
jgi:hypothetical protein